MFVDFAREIMRLQAHSIELAASRLGHSFEELISELLRLSPSQRLVTSGIGKSGHVARKIAATLASTGTPSFFVHTTEAAHGDLGMIRPEDSVLFLSYSGESEELIGIIPNLKKRGNRIYSFTSNLNSRLAKNSDIVVEILIEREGCPLDLAPMSSTTVALSLGDALAASLMKARNFKSSDFALFHPSGRLGKRLTLKVRDLIKTDLPIVHPHNHLRDSLITMSSKGFGLIIVLDEYSYLMGIFTDGDLRRYFDSLNSTPDPLCVPISDLMKANPITIRPDAMAIEALEIMQKHKILHLIVTENTKKVCGLISLYDLLSIGL